MPNTPEGKAIVARNAVRHGLYTAVTVCAGREAEGDWFAFHDATVEVLAPEGALESALASRAASLLWRLRRVPVAEADAIERAAALPAIKEGRRLAEESRLRRELGEDNFYAQGLAEPRHQAPLPPDTPDDAVLAFILRTEAHLNRQLRHTLRELETLQQRRAGRAMRPVGVDVQGPPAP